MKKKYLLLTLLFFSLHAAGQEIKIDLSKGKEFTQTISPQSFSSIILQNTLVDGKYVVKVIKEIVPFSPPALPSFSSITSRPACKLIEDAMTELDGEEKEANIPEKVFALKKIIDKTKSSDSCESAISKALASIAKTEQNVPLITAISLEKGQKVTITVKRDDEEWKYELLCPAPERFKVYFGFTYVPDALTKFDNYYSKEDTGSTYLITQSRRERNTLRNISPTVMVTYHFYKKMEQPIKFGITAGFSYNLEDFSSLIGPSITIGDFISLNTGIALAQKDMLKGKYNAGDKISENLDFDQLHTKTWTYDLFFSIGLRFEGLFKKVDEKEKTTSK